MNFQDKYISTLEDILSLRQELQSNSLLILKAEEQISRKMGEIAELERKLSLHDVHTAPFDDISPKIHDIPPQTHDIPPQTHDVPPQTHDIPPQTHDVHPQTHDVHNSRVALAFLNDKENTPRFSKTKPKKAKSSSLKSKKNHIEKKKQIEKSKQMPIRKSLDLSDKKETELPPIEIDPQKYIDWNPELQGSLICWNEIIKSTHPGTLSQMNFTDKFRIEQAIHDFLSTRLHWRDIQYCVAISRNNIPLIAIPEGWADDFSDWLSERIGAGLFDSKVKEKRRNPKMQPVLGVKHGNEYKEFPDTMILVYPEFRSWLEIVRIRFPAFVVGFIHEEFVRDYLLSKNIAFNVVHAELEKDNAWGVPLETEEQFFNSFIAMFHYNQNGRKIYPKTHWQIPKCQSIEYLNNDNTKSFGSSMGDISGTQPSNNSHVQESQGQSQFGIFGSNQAQNLLRPFRKAIVNGTELFHWRDVVEDKFSSEYDDLLNNTSNELIIHNAIRQFLNGSLLPSGLEPANCYVCFSDDSDSDEEDAEEEKDYGIPSILKEEFELWFSTQAENGFTCIILPPEKDDDEDEFEDDQAVVNKSL